jgi:hypothetical protein
MTSALSITNAVNPPRAAFLDFPLGYTTGKPRDVDGQRAILRAALAGFETIHEPGGLVTLPFVWAEDDSWKDTVMRQPATDCVAGTVAIRDERAARVDTPQYQCERDRELAERAQREGGCPTCVWVE